MADALLIDPATVFDNVDERRVEFSASADTDEYAFAAQYDLIEALAAEVPDDRAVALFHRHEGQIMDLAAVALARDPDQAIIVVSENDLA
ncbi:hypothetical protein GCM10022268_05540 [Sphingomonas cynarae]|uniref:DUF1488 family protein n=1 Tax=Sphingomonas cynarae TaxID=930197 RepID=A0ABP7D1E1_9SPHN